MFNPQVKTGGFGGFAPREGGRLRCGLTLTPGVDDCASGKVPFPRWCFFFGETELFPHVFPGSHRFCPPAEAEVQITAASSNQRIRPFTMIVIVAARYGLPGPTGADVGGVLHWQNPAVSPTASSAF
jgi:hypothetical protein